MLKSVNIAAIVLGLGLVACNERPKYIRKGDSGAGQLEKETDREGNEDQIEEGGPNSPKNPKKPGTDNGPATTLESSAKNFGLTCQTDNPKGFRAWRRLSNVEFRNTISDVFGSDAAAEVNDLPGDVRKHEIYDTMMVPVNFIDSEKLRAYQKVGRKAAAKVELAKVFPCLKEGESCISKTLVELGSRAWRRPLVAEEVAKFASAFAATVADGLSAEDAARIIIQGLIVSPHFLYRSELGEKTADGDYKLTDWEVASALSYSILRRPPDETLRKLAASKSLGEVEAIRTQAQRLVADPLAKAAWKDFANMWLDSKAVIDTVKTAKEFDMALRQRSRDEVGDLFADVLSKTGSSTLESLLTADSVPGTGANAIYDAMPSNGQIQFKEKQRRGVLGQTSFLASHSNVEETSPVKRGAFVIERMLCIGFAAVPAFELPKKKEGQSNRDRYLELGKSPACASCHDPINSFGFMFENFDHLGRFRTEAEGQEIKTESKVVIDGEKVSVAGPAELSAAIARSKQGRECFVRHVFRYGLGRLEYAPLPIIGEKKKTTENSAQVDADSCQIKAIADSMEEANGDIKVPIINLLTSPSFLRRVDRKSELSMH